MDIQTLGAAIAIAKKIFGGSGSSGISNHSQLSHRDAADQHPMSAITGLVAALNGKGTYSKPSGGIPASDMASAVQTSLGKADTAVQPSALNSYATQTYVNQQIAAQTAETWTFTLDDDTTVTKQILVKAVSGS